MKLPNYPTPMHFIEDIEGITAVPMLYDIGQGTK